MEYKSEAHLQSLCTKWFRENYLSQYDRLFLVYNNPPNAAMAGLLKSMGLRRGPADQVYYAPRGKKVWIEYKLGNKSQSDDQLAFQAMVEAYGEKYYVVKTEEEFKYLIKTIN